MIAELNSRCKVCNSKIFIEDAENEVERKVIESKSLKRANVHYKAECPICDNLITIHIDKNVKLKNLPDNESD